MGANQSFLESLEWRRAVKHFGETDIDTEPIRTAIVAAPSSFGLQPYKVLAVKNRELKQLLQPACYDQCQIVECDTLFVFCTISKLATRAEEYISATGADSSRDMIMGFLNGLQDKRAWSARQAYIALGFAMAAAAESKILGRVSPDKAF